MKRLRMFFECKRDGTTLVIAGKLEDPIIQQIRRWGTTCPACKGDLDPFYTKAFDDGDTAGNTGYPVAGGSIRSGST